MPRLVFLLMVAILLAFPVAAQDDAQPPDYQIFVMQQPTLKDDTFTVAFGIYNIGGAADTEATVILTVATTGEQLGIETVPAIPAQGTETVEFAFDAGQFAPGSVQSLQASVGIGEVEPRGGPTISNNSVRTGLNVPQNIATSAGGKDTADASEGAGSRFTIPGTQIEIDLQNPLHVGILVAVVLVGLVLLWVATIILRLLFQKSPSLGPWQPPYTPAAVLDPDSTAGRRQLWQPHAQNDALLLPCQEGAYHIRKLLFGTDGDMLSGWQITALRLSQYDMYGRVARTHTVASGGLVRRLDRAAHKDNLDRERAAKLVRPVARSLVGQFDKRLSKKNAGLPVALDVRLRGTHGEARILFELFGCRRGEWELIDHWEPEMMVVHGAINENFTYTMFGQTSDENYREFRQRLEDEIAQIFAEMLLRERAIASAPAPVAPVRMPSVEQYVHQDTAPHPPAD